VPIQRSGVGVGVGVGVSVSFGPRLLRWTREEWEKEEREKKKIVDMWVAIYCLWSIEVSKKVRIATLLEEEKEKKKKIAKFNLLVKVALLLEMP
jgi:hypothetical protein